MLPVNSVLLATVRSGYRDLRRLRGRCILATGPTFSSGLSFANGSTSISAPEGAIACREAQTASSGSPMSCSESMKQIRSNFSLLLARAELPLQTEFDRPLRPASLVPAPRRSRIRGSQSPRTSFGYACAMRMTEAPCPQPRSATCPPFSSCSWTLLRDGIRV